MKRTKNLTNQLTFYLTEDELYNLKEYIKPLKFSNVCNYSQFKINKFIVEHGNFINPRLLFGDYEQVKYRKIRKVVRVSETVKTTIESIVKSYSGLKGYPNTTSKLLHFIVLNA